MSDEKRINVLIIGDEVLSRSVPESNLDYVLQKAAAAAYRVNEVAIVGDSVHAISTAIKRLYSEDHYLITSGGVGPTHDDVTMQGVAAAFSLPLLENAKMKEFLLRVYGPYSTDAVFRMAQLPQGMEVELSEDGLWPLMRLDHCYVLPGLPRAFRARVDRIMAALPQQKPFWVALAYSDCDESVFAAELAQIQENFPQVIIGSYPVIHSEAGYAVRLSLRGRVREEVQLAWESLLDEFGQHGWISSSQPPVVADIKAE